MLLSMRNAERDAITTMKVKKEGSLLSNRVSTRGRLKVNLSYSDICEFLYRTATVILCLPLVGLCLGRLTVQIFLHFSVLWSFYR